MNNAEDALTRWTEVVDAPPMPNSAREDARRRMLEAFDAAEAPRDDQVLTLVDAGDQPLEVDEPVIVRPAQPESPRRWLLYVAAATGLLVLLIAGLTRSSGNSVEIAQPAGDADSIVEAGSMIGPGRHLVDDFVIPFFIDSSSTWNVLAESRTLVVLADSSTDRVNSGLPEIIDVRTLAVRLFETDGAPSMADVDELFEVPPPGVNVQSLVPFDLAGVPARRVQLDVDPNGACLDGDVVCQRFPLTESNSHPLSRDRSYVMFAMPTPDGIVLASIVQVDDQDAWNGDGLAALESVELVSASTPLDR